MSEMERGFLVHQYEQSIVIRTLRKPGNGKFEALLGSLQNYHVTDHDVPGFREFLSYDDLIIIFGESSFEHVDFRDIVPVFRYIYIDVCTFICCRELICPPHIRDIRKISYFILL